MSQSSRPPPPRRPPNDSLRVREYLTENEVEQLIIGAQTRGRHRHRDSTMILLAYRHGLRASELVNLRWEQVDFTLAVLHVRRVKQGTPTVHPLGKRELAALADLKTAHPTASPFVFLSERGKPLQVQAFRRLINRIVEKLNFPLKVHPHMLRHGCGYKLANDGQDTRAIQAYLGHKNIQHTVRYTELASGRFKGFWDD